MKYIITENKLLNMLSKFIKFRYPNLYKLNYDWAEYNCGMGVCCDPYAIGFHFPGSDYNDYIFKLVDSDNYDSYGNYPKELGDELPEVCYEQPILNDTTFDKYMIGEDLYEELETVFGHFNNWKNQLLLLLNSEFGTEATEITLLY